ncbi:MAG: 3-deoxy-7-phosphoheptulonate synthase [Cycloclasticus sp.]|nr:3-deoxy-7-phosphoheptulonate synthase [Cycloclasticus sp.]MBG95806.1 3-deoxy-7-phosphoheptulonate synthase [Cycloclasticus sp.]HAI97678.1 3-deoxy-7-phosphoheptulonate synthase [Methylococcaceae bacterium]
MNTIQTDDLRILGMQEVISPEQLLNDLPITETAAKTTADARTAIHNILHDKDDRLLVVIGPCSIHDTKAALEYASRLKPYIDRLSDDLIIVMRVYFEKPRTTVGWKGLINDPDLDDSFDINKGLHTARELLLNLNTQGVSAATEYLDLITPQYVSDLIAWGAIGARTTESQTHRELSSGLSCPVGFKNGTDGTIKVAIDAIGAAVRPHHFLSVTKQGQSAIFKTAGNEDCHLILRGGKTPNYDAKSVDAAANELGKAGVNLHIMIDCSHANSSKQHEQQMIVGADVAKQIAGGDMRISGVMIESHLVAGRQDVVDGQELTYGQSITDACIDWDSSVQLLEELASAVRKRRESKIDTAND